MGSTRFAGSGRSRLDRRPSERGGGRKGGFALTGRSGTTQAVQSTYHLAKPGVLDSVYFGARDRISPTVPGPGDRISPGAAGGAGDPQGTAGGLGPHGAFCSADWW